MNHAGVRFTNLALRVSARNNQQGGFAPLHPKRKAQMKLSKLFDGYTVGVERIVNRPKNPAYYTESDEWRVSLKASAPSENTDGEIEPIDLVLNHSFFSRLSAAKMGRKVFEKGEINPELWVKASHHELLEWADGDGIKRELTLSR